MNLVGGDAELALEVRGLTKRFGATTALKGVDLAVHRGERHALLGENGAGKSTLIKILTGLITPEQGSVSLPDQERDTIAVVHQELSLVPTLSVQENLALGQLPSRFGIVRRRALRDAAKSALARVGLDIHPATEVGQLELAERQLVEIARALQANPALLLLDEPTSSLNAGETERLFHVIRELATAGTAVLFVSHRLDEVYALCENATVLRDGQVVGHVDLATTRHDQLVRLMVGRELASEEATADGRVPSGAAALGIDGLTGPGYEDVDLEIGHGEIVGLAGLIGAGQGDLARTLGGLNPPHRGQVLLHANPLRLTAPRGVIASGVAYVPADRALEGLILNLSVARNAALPSIRSASPMGWVDWSRVREIAATVIQRFGVLPPRADLPLTALSGGNQQKIVVGKWFVTEPQLVVLDDPTRGVDVGAKAAIHRLVREAAEGGTAVLVLSSDLAELALLSHRVVVFRGGRVVGQLTGGQAAEAPVLELATGRQEALA